MPSLARAVSRPSEPTTCFSVTADLEPGVLPRVLELFAKRGLTPAYCCARVAGGELTVDLQVRSLPPELAAHLAACFRQIPAVVTVLTCERG